MNGHEAGEIVHDDAEESFLLVYLCLIGSFVYFLWSRRDRAKYNQIPSVGFSGTLLSFISAVKCLYNPVGMLKTAYTQFPSGVFRYPTLSRWIVVVTKPKYVEELRKVSEDELSASQALNEIVQLPYMIDSKLLANADLKSLLGAQLMRNLHQTLPDIYSEMEKRVSELIPSGDDGWRYIDEAEILTRLCSRIVNLALLGSSVCQNPEYMDLSITATRNLERYGRKLQYLPAIFQSLFAFLFTPFPRIKRKLHKMLACEIQERQEYEDKFGGSPHNDMITWFLTNDAKADVPVNDLVNHILLVNYLAVHPMSKIMIEAFRKLAQYPEYAKEMRLEVEAIHRQDGWSKSAVDKMQRVDSFLKETMRLETSTNNASYPCLSMARVALRPITFSSGATLPPNTLLFTGSQLIHLDGRNYAEPDTFNPSRFASPLSSDPSFSKASSSKPMMSVPASLTLPATSSTFLAWGHGKHACPGRFFASSVMKLILAYFVLNFEFRLPPLLDESRTEGREGDKKEGNILWIEVKRRQHKSKIV